jgi:hypothetical protein
MSSQLVAHDGRSCLRDGSRTCARRASTTERLGTVSIAQTVHRGADAPTTAGGPPTRQGHPIFFDGWPLAWLLVGFPVWWVLGLSTFAPIILAVPMAAYLIQTRSFKVPPGFGLWLVLLACMFISIGMLGVNPPGTVPKTFTHRLGTDLLGIGQYVAATVIMLYIGNHRGMFFQRRVVKWLSVLCVVVVVGGLVGMVAPNFQLTSPLEYLLPPALRANHYIHTLVHPVVAQAGNNALGKSTPRPAAPFTFTNTWGNVLSVLLVWLIPACTPVQLRRKSTAVIVFVVALVPIFYSLNRGMWLGLLVMAIYNALRVSRLKLSAVVPSLAIVGVVVVAVFSIGSTRGIILDRFQHGQSNDIRTYTTQQSIKLAESSPIIGYGTDRTSLGGEKSIAIGRSAACPRCGNPVLGENGELWSLLVSDGLVGVFLYYAFIGYGIRRFWRDRTPVGIAGVGTLILAIGYSFIYNASGMPLVLYLIAYALLWHNEQNRPVPG